MEHLYQFNVVSVKIKNFSTEDQIKIEDGTFKWIKNEENILEKLELRNTLRKISKNIFFYILD